MRFKIVLDIDLTVSGADRRNLHSLIVDNFLNFFCLLNSHIVDVKLFAEAAKLHFGNAVCFACSNLTGYALLAGFITEC